MDRRLSYDLYLPFKNCIYHDFDHLDKYSRVNLQLGTRKGLCISH